MNPPSNAAQVDRRVPMAQHLIEYQIEYQWPTIKRVHLRHDILIEFCGPGGTTFTIFMSEIVRDFVAKRQKTQDLMKLSQQLKRFRRIVDSAIKLKTRGAKKALTSAPVKKKRAAKPKRRKT